MTIEIAGSTGTLRTVGEIAAALPGATGVFRRFGLDFCCKGDVPLEEAARERGVDVADVEHALQALKNEPGTPALSLESAALIDHILARYHDVHRRELPELVRLARKVEAVHAGHAKVPKGLADLLAAMAKDLDLHMSKEELVLFPGMKHAMPALDAPIARMRHEHNDHGAHLREVEALTDNLSPPSDACATWRALYGGLSKFTDDLMQHIHLENNVLFPKFSAPSN
jgi:regulator of cell morphogenesis and NO signaling